MTRYSSSNANEHTKKNTSRKHSSTKKAPTKKAPTKKSSTKKASTKKLQKSVTITSEELPINTQVKVLKFLKDINQNIQKTNYEDLLSFAEDNKEFLSMKLNGNTLMNILEKTNETHFERFKKLMRTIETIERKSLTGGSSGTMVLRRRSINRNSPRNTVENNNVIGLIKSVNNFLGNPDVKIFIMNMAVLILFVCFMVMVSRGLLRSNKAIEFPDLGENAIVTLGTTAIIGLVIIGSVKMTTKTFSETVLRKKKIEQQMQAQYLQTVNNSAVTYGARGFAAMPQGQMGMPMQQGQMGMPMIQGQMGMPMLQDNSYAPQQYRYY